MKVSQKVIVVTGAGGGIGSELVLQLLARGARVAAVDLKQESLDGLMQRAGSHADALSLHALNITTSDAVSALPDAVIAAHGRVDGLINCAGIIQPFVRVNDLDFTAIERVMNVNFYGTLHMTKAFLPHLLTRPEAHLANVSSMGGFLPVPGQTIYGASKAAVKLLTEGLYAELLDTPVHVTVIFPGATKTNITQNSDVTGAGTPSAEDAKTDASAKKLQASMLAPEVAAKIMLDGIEANKPRIFTGKDASAMDALYRLSPIRATKLIASKMRSLLK